MHRQVDAASLQGRNPTCRFVSGAPSSSSERAQSGGKGGGAKGTVKGQPCVPFRRADGCQMTRSVASTAQSSKESRREEGATFIRERSTTVAEVYRGFYRFRLFGSGGTRQSCSLHIRVPSDPRPRSTDNRVWFPIAVESQRQLAQILSRPWNPPRTGAQPIHRHRSSGRFPWKSQLKHRTRPSCNV